jgi:hypothetical protein
MTLATKRAALALCIGVGLSIPAFGQSDPALQKAVQARQAAQRAGNAEEWGKYTTDDFLLTFTDGSVTTKQQRMSMIAGRPTPAIARADEKWRMYGTTAILTAEEVIFGKRTRLTAVWVKEQGLWKVAAVQFTIVAP